MDKSRTLSTCKLLSFVVVFVFIIGACAQNFRQPECEQGSCNPATGDLLIGRQENLTASSTCGLDRPSRYCVVSYLEEATSCFTCNSMQPYSEPNWLNSHRVENMVSSFKEDRLKRWWQAETGNEKVYIQLDLEAEFHLTHMIMTFKTFRPKAMLIERSFDFGKTWKVYRYFAESCRKSFPQVTKRFVNDLSDVICDENYSAETPSTKGEVIFRVLPPYIKIPDPYSEEVQDLLKVTNLRINFTELHTLGDTLLDSRPEIKEKYYYSLYDMTVRGSCSCHGHASRCLPVEGHTRDEFTSRNMVHGRCECSHNTTGLNCEMCQEFYQDLPWRPSSPNNTAACKACNCNGHATRCHFDAARYLASGEVSGGVCDDCQHNTMGVNCQECLDFYYQDPFEDMRSISFCQPCDCDPLGSLDQGMCEKVTDDIAGTVAGQCRCKPFVEGERCDVCKHNYWNMTKDNPLGCEPCSCNPDGTVADRGGCDMETGLCTCKRHVQNMNCDSCYPGYYGLSADNPEGCKSCACDIGGSYGSSCDDATGQCNCRPHISGRHCSKVEPGYFFAHRNHYIFEAEYGKAGNQARVYVREGAPGRVRYWTGTGYMTVTNGDYIEITVSGLPFSTYYDIIIRYDDRISDVFEDVRVAVIRPEQVDPDGLCGGFEPSDDIKVTDIDAGARYLVVKPPSCLEKDTSYTIRIDFNGASSDSYVEVNIDSILLAPNPKYIPIYQGEGYPEHQKNEFLGNYCDTSQYDVRYKDMSDMCKKQQFSISAVFHDGALACDCDRTGSTSVECDPSGGQCPCKPNVVGRRCDQCAPGTYGFGPEGCSPCSCHNHGSRDRFCEEVTGQCSCNQNIAGRACDDCRYGYWGFPQCRPCECSGNAETCDLLTGECIDCANFTTGRRCDRCEDGYYGAPHVGQRIPCRPCMCPAGPGSPAQHADTCNFYPRTNEVYCNCRQGYTGLNCDTCIANYFGSPTAPGGKCEPCVCSNNIDTNDPRSCDSDTGECLKCLYNTEGFACEHCKSGYYGDATRQNCQTCVCNSLGTDYSRGECDRVTGQCPCLPNVVGQRCDQCEANHWNITSNQGCTPCDCDPTGSESLQCNQLSGQCRCLPGRGGLQCADCEDLFFGDPNTQCLPCDCNMQGSSGRQCDRRTGQCKCVVGVTGYKCDRCARGTTGDLPNCVPCGECFDNWDKIIMGLRDQTHGIVRRANDVSVTGAIKAFDDEFRMMQASIDEIKQILSGVNLTQVDIQDITDKIDRISDNLANHTLRLNEVQTELRNSSARVKKGDLRVDVLKKKVAGLKTLAMQLKENATDIQIGDAGGAYNKVREAQVESQAAQDKVDGTADHIEESERLRNETERVIEQGEEAFKMEFERNMKALNAVESGVDKLEGDLSDINGLVCGVRESSCSSLCGGGGCDKCGGPGCNGATTLAANALNLAREAEDQLSALTRNATEVLEPQIEDARQQAMEAHEQARMAYDAANEVNNQTTATNADLKELLDKIREFLIGNNTNSPEDVEKVVEEVLNMSIPLSPDEIKEMADKISTALASLTDIDKILNETEEKRKIADELKQQAKEASDDAQDIRNTAQLVRNALDEAREVQEKAKEAIEQAKTDIQDAKDDLRKIKNATGQANNVSRSSRTLLEELQQKLDGLTTRYTALKIDTLNQAEAAAQDADKLAKDAYEKALELNATYAATSEELDNKHNDTERARNLSIKLKERADNMFKLTETQRSQLKDIESKLEGDETRLSKLSDEIQSLIDQMDGYLATIRTKAKDFETC